MNESLKDQLMALGLAPKKPKRKTVRQRKAAPKKARQSDAEISLDQAYRVRDQQERQQKAQVTARNRELERQRREVNQKIKAIIKAGALRDETADIKRNFLYKGKIRSVLVTSEQMQALNTGSLGVVYLRGNYHLLAAADVDEVRKFAADHVPELQGIEREDEKDHPVPDDLTW